MKAIFIFMSLIFSTLVLAQDRISFSYDAAGNQIVRSLCINCQTAKHSNEIKEVEALKQDDLLKFSSEDSFSYYPNPVKEELYLYWETKDDNALNNIKIYNINGQILQNIDASKLKNNAQSISFALYPAGIYLASITYKNGDQKTIKIIKQ